MVARLDSNSTREAGPILDVEVSSDLPKRLAARSSPKELKPHRNSVCCVHWASTKRKGTSWVDLRRSRTRCSRLGPHPTDDTRGRYVTAGQIAPHARHRKFGCSTSTHAQCCTYPTLSSSALGSLVHLPLHADPCRTNPNSEHHAERIESPTVGRNSDPRQQKLTRASGRNELRTYEPAVQDPDGRGRRIRRRAHGERTQARWRPL